MFETLPHLDKYEIAYFSDFLMWFETNVFEIENTFSLDFLT